MKGLRLIALVTLAVALFASVAAPQGAKEDIKKAKKAISSGKPTERIGGAEELAKIDDPEALAALLNQLKSEREEGVIVTLLDAIKTKGAPSEDVVNAVTPKLKSKFWQIADGAAKILAGSKNKAAIEPLVDALGAAEKSKNIRLRNDISEALKAITGEDKVDFAGWKGWWDQNKENFALPEASKQAANDDKKETSVATFYEIPVKSNNFIFVVDMSGSMADKSSWKPSSIDTGRTLKDLGIPDKPDGDKKIDVVKYELMKVIAFLPEGVKFNIITYRSAFHVYSDKMVEINKVSRRKTIDWVKSLQAEGSTNIFDSMEEAFTHAGAKAAPAPRDGKASGVTTVDVHIVSDGIDTIFLLSDGIANVGKIVNTAEIRKRIGEMNKVRKIIIHTVAVGNDADETLMEGLAKDSGGTYVKH